jgi:mycothiol synthase
MDAHRFRRREFTDADFPAFAEIWNRQVPMRPTTADRLREGRTMYEDPEGPGRYLAVEETSSGRLVATALIVVPTWGAEPGTFFVDVLVDPDFEHRGIGRSLAEALTDQGRAWGGRRLRAELRGDVPRPLAFAQAQGFLERRRTWASIEEIDRVDLGSLPDRRAELAAAGIVLTTLAEEGPDRPEVRRAVFEAQRSASEDIPRTGGYRPPEFAAYVRSTFESSTLTPASFFLARAGARYVGLSVLERIPAEPETLHLVYTGTVPEFRRRGIATELKRRTVEYARAHGYRRIRTTNDSRNDRMWRINERLGYARAWPFVHAEKPLDGPPAP